MKMVKQNLKMVKYNPSHHPPICTELPRENWVTRYKKQIIGFYRLPWGKNNVNDC